MALQNTFFDVIISGAGPAGLTAGICCARAGLSVLICEKGTRPAPLPRGETVHDHPVFDEFLGKGILAQISTFQTAGRKFNSPFAEKMLITQRKTPSFVFPWEKFIDQLWSEAKKAGVQFQFNTEVQSPIIHNGICVGFITKQNTSIMGRTTLVCDGYGSLLGSALQIPYQEMNTWIIKRLITNFYSDYAGFEYFFVPMGILSEAPKFPSCIIFIFPRGNSNCEVGLMINTQVAKQLSPLCEIPSETELLRVWNLFIEKYPRFSVLMRNTTTIFEYCTRIPVESLFLPSCPQPGCIILGDAMGFVEVSGMSGISCSMQEAWFAGKFLAQHKNSEWTKALQDQYNAEFEKTEIFHHINKLYKIIPKALLFLFKILRTPKKINQWWWLVKRFYK